LCTLRTDGRLAYTSPGAWNQGFRVKVKQKQLVDLDASGCKLALRCVIYRSAARTVVREPGRRP
jgi:hypothetical protein